MEDVSVKLKDSALMCNSCIELTHSDVSRATFAALDATERIKQHILSIQDSTNKV